MNILIAEDEPAMQKIISLYLQKEGWHVSVASNGEEALEKLWSGFFDLVIADWMMPVMDGITLCRDIKKAELSVKIIMLTAKDQVQHEIEGLTGGADDYIRKPFEPKLLILRIRKLMHMEHDLCCGDLKLSPVSMTAFLKNTNLKLTQKEFLLLQTFLLNKGLTLTRSALLNRVWGDEYDGDERTLDTHIRRLRNKIGKDMITTYVGIGYRMEEPHE